MNPRGRITFEMTPAAAGIVQRAAVRCGLRWFAHDDLAKSAAGYVVFTVELTDAFDAYRLGQACVQDSAWSRDFQGARTR
jgi:hypothetical protein